MGAQSKTHTLRSSATMRVPRLNHISSSIYRVAKRADVGRWEGVPQLRDTLAVERERYDGEAEGGFSRVTVMVEVL